MLSRFFIARPIFAWVVAIGIMLAGLAGITTLPVSQYPDIASPVVNIDAHYPGANAATLESSVTQVIEQQLAGLDGLLYFASTSSAAGSVHIAVTFAAGTNPDTAQVQVQNKVQQANSRLPSQVQQQGVTVTKANPDFLMLVAIHDESDRSTSTDVADWIVNHLQDAVSRVNGVGNFNIFGSGYAMRIWLDPYRLAARRLMPSDVTAAVQTQNADVSAGQIGQTPAVKGQQLNAVVNAQSRLQTPEQFRRIVVKTETDGSVVRLGDVARVEMGNDSYQTNALYNGHPAAGLALQLAPGVDALKTAEAVKARVTQLTRHLPPGYVLSYPKDSTTFIRLSVKEVVKTLVEAVVLVVIVMFVFLQNWRATLIPAIAVPVVLLGTFGVLAVLGYSINTLTLFGMVLAIGLLVDDAIVVVENVERLIAEEGLAPREAAEKSMDQIGSALVGVALVLSAVLLPMAFFGGSTGVIYRQFSVTIISAMALSVLVALILTPSIAATLLKAHEGGDRKEGRGIAARFNRGLDAMTDRYCTGVGAVMARRLPAFAVYAVLLVGLYLLFSRLPTSFVPQEDQGQAGADFFLPAGATQERTAAVAQQIQHYYSTQEQKDVTGLFTVTGGNGAGNGQNAGNSFIVLSPFARRTDASESVTAINDRAGAWFKQHVVDARVVPQQPPPLPGLGPNAGFTFELLNSGGLSAAQFRGLRDRLIAAANRDPALSNVRVNALPDTPQLQVTLDEAKLAVLGLAQANVTATLSTAWGGSYVNDFVDRGRVKRVYVQGDAPYRMLPADIKNWYVRSSVATTTTGYPLMVPFASFATTGWTTGPTTLSRFNGLSSYELQGDVATGTSSGVAMQRMAALQAQLPAGTTFAWSALSYQEQQSSGQAPMLYGMSVLVVFLCLAALYESWSIPFAVLLVIPLGLIGAVLAVTLRGLDNNIYFQVGLLTTMGLAAKNAILIVEYAEMLHAGGKPPDEAALEAAKLRLRPILMTSIAFIAGVFPLAIASGVGANSRVAIGTAVVGGMVSATVLAIFYVPMFFFAINRLFKGRKEVAARPEASNGEVSSPGGAKEQPA